MPRSLSYIVALPLLAPACVVADIGEGEEDPALEEIELAADNGIFLDNGLNLPNGMNLGNGTALHNGMNLGNGVDLANGMNLGNGLNLGNGITGPFYAPPAGSGLEQWIDVDPPARVKILRYLVECALPAGVEVQLLYRGSLSTLAVGVAGLGDSLQDGVMLAAHQERVSACMLARVNGTGQTVQIDMFGPMGADAAAFENRTLEDDGFPLPEAAFFGNLFAATPEAYACQVLAAPLSASRSCRDLGDGAHDCGVIEFTATKCPDSPEHHVVQCDIVFTYDPTLAYYTNCIGGENRWQYVLTTFLAARPDGEMCSVDWQCASGACVDSVCGARSLLPRGARCYANAECASNVCSLKRKVCQ